MFCTNCGAKIDDDSKFCPECGTVLEEQNVQEMVSTPINNEAAITQQPIMQQSVMQQPIMQQSNMQQPNIQQPTMQMNNGMPMQPAKPMKKATKILIAEAAVLVLALVGTYQLGKSLTDPKKIATNFFEAEWKGDSEALYDMMELPTNDFLTKEQFIESNKSVELKNITNYKVEDMGRDYDFVDLSGADSKKSKSLVKGYSFEYRVAGEEDSNYETIQLVKQKGKKWFFYDDWKVSPIEQTASNVTITVPRDAIATMNGQNLSEVAKENEDYSGNEYISYNLPTMFTGTYTVQVSAPGREEVEQEIAIENYSNYQITDLPIADATVEELTKDIYSVINAYYTGLINYTSYQNMMDSIGIPVSENIDLQYNYENIINSEDISKNYYAYVYDAYHIYDIVGNVDSGYYENDGNGNSNFTVYMQFTGKKEQAGYEIYKHWNGELEKTPVNDMRDLYGRAAFTYVNNEWKLIEFSIN